MAVEQIGRKHVAFTIEIRGVVEMDYVVGQETPVQAMFRHFRRGPIFASDTSAIENLLRICDDFEAILRSDETRNYPNELGGYLMPDDETTLICECGRAFVEPSCACGRDSG